MVLKYCGVAIFALICVLILKSQKSQLATVVSLSASVILVFTALSAFAPLFGFIKEAIGNTGFGKYFSVLLKAMGVTLSVQLTSELCRDSGEGGIASKLELVGKAEVLVLCLPLIKELISLAADIINI